MTDLHRNKPTGWMDYAACNGMDGDIFFPERGEDVGRAKRVCATCPARIRQACLEYAETAPKETAGVWGGMSASERQRLRWPSRKQRRAG